MGDARLVGVLACRSVPTNLPSPPTRAGPSYWFRVAVAAHFAAFAAGLAFDQPLICALAVASSAALALLEYARRDGSFRGLCLLLGFVLGNVLVFGYANAAHVYLTDLRRGIGHDLTAWLAAAMVWSAVAGGWITHKLVGREPGGQRIDRSSLARSWQATAVAGTIFAIFAAVRWSTGYLNARWDLAAQGSFGATYIVDGINNSVYILFFLLGARLQRKLVTSSNLIAFAIAAAVALGNALTGGREYAGWVILLFVLGASASQLSRRSLVGVILTAAVLGAVMMAAVGQARTRSGFAFGSVSDRLEALGDAASGGEGSAAEDDSAFESVVSRVYEFSAQDVVDHSESFGAEAGFEHFDRLLYLFVPLYFAPNKELIDDGPEVLMRDYGYRLTAYTSVPITLVADAFRRGRWPWVIAVGLLAGVWLRLLARMTLRIVGHEFGLVTLALLTLLQFRGYTRSVIGYISLLSYDWLKQVAIMLFVVMVVRLLTMMTTRTSPASGPPSTRGTSLGQATRRAPLAQD